MTFTTHGVVGAGIRAAAGHALGFSEETCIYLAALGAVEGMAPDAIDFLAWVFGAERWRLYSRMHTGNLRWFGLVFWGFAAHLITDLPFHKNPGEDWWPRLWWLEIFSLATGIAMLGYAFAP